MYLLYLCGPSNNFHYFGYFKNIYDDDDNDDDDDADADRTPLCALYHALLEQRFPSRTAPLISRFAVTLLN